MALQSVHSTVSILPRPLYFTAENSSFKTTSLQSFKHYSQVSASAIDLLLPRKDWDADNKEKNRLLRSFESGFGCT